MMGTKPAEYLLKNEKYIFLAICVITLLPVFTGQYFVTLDGPSHLYNSKVWSFLVFDSQPFLSKYYSLNSLMPNAISHILLSFLMTFMPAFIAEKILIIAYVFLFAFSFRFLLKSFGKSNILFSYLIFPFIFSYPFLLGFYNFSFGIILLFFIIGFWLKNDHSRFSWQFLLGLAILVFLTYTSHLVLFGILLLMLALETGITLFHAVKGTRYKTVKARIISLLAATVLPLYFVCQYLADRPLSDSVFNSIGISTLLQYLYDLRPIIAFNYEREVPFSRIIFLVLMALGLIYLIKQLSRKKLGIDKHANSNDIAKRLFAGIALPAFLFLYFFLPDSDGRGSYVSIRLGLLIFPFLILFLSLQKFSRLTQLAAISIVLLAHFVLVAQYGLVNKQVNPVIQEISKVSELIEPNSIVAVVKETEAWYMAHFSNYLGLEKPMVILDNYEASNGYFPVIWNQSAFPKISIHGNEVNEIPCLKFKSNANGINTAANYLLVIGNSENLKKNCIQLYELITSDNVIMLHQSQQCSLYKL